MASDAVQLAASIADLAKLSYKIVQRLGIYGRDIARVPSRSEELRREINDLINLQYHLERFFDDGDLHPGTRMDSVVKDFEELLQSILARIDPTNVKGVQRLWPFLQSENEEYIARIGKLKSEMSLVLSVVQTDLIQMVERRVRTVEERVEASRSTEKLDDILNKFCMPSIEPIKDQKRRKSLLTKGTGEWIFEHECYKVWSKTPGSFLWINGHVGVGKTVLTSSIISAIEKLADTFPPPALVGPAQHIGVAYFYCDGRSVTNNLAATVVGSLLRQLTEKMISAVGASSSVLKRYGGNFNSTIEYFHESLEWSFESFTEVYLIIDGLDECWDRASLLRMLCSLGANNIKVLVTSRPEIDICTALRDKPSLGIDDHIMDDIATHVAWAMESEAKLSLIRPELKLEIQKDLIERCGGIWISCQLDYLKTLRCDRDRRNALKSLPPDLPQTYLFMLDRISRNSKDIRFATAALTWLLYGSKSLTISELALASSINPDHTFSDEDRLANDLDVLEICSSLVKVSSDKRVELAHFSVKEFFCSEKLPNTEQFNPYFISDAAGKEFIAKASISYLSCPEFILKSWPTEPISRVVSTYGNLYDYVSTKWSSYATASKLSERPDLVDRIVKLLRNSEGQSWLLAWYRGERHQRTFFYFFNHMSLDALIASTNTVDRMPPCSPPTPLYISVTERFYQVTSTLLDAGSSPNQQGGYLEFPIFSAIQNEDITMIRLLLEKGKADPNVIGKGGKTPLHVAASFWLPKIVGILLEFNADITIRTPSGEIPLMSALGPTPTLEGVVLDTVADRHMDVPPVALLEGLIPAEPLSFRGQANPLHIAAERALLDAARLVSHPSYLNEQDHNGNTPLHLAAQSGYVQMVDFLLSSGADQTIRNKIGWTPLHCALWFGELIPIERLQKRHFFPESSREYALSQVEWMASAGGNIRWQQYHTRNSIMHRRDSWERVRRGISDDILELVLEHLAKESPLDHLLTSFLALCRIRQSRFHAGIKLYYSSLRMNERSHGQGIEEIAHGLPCEKCSKEIVGSLFICAICGRVYCHMCVESDTPRCERHAFMHPIPWGDLYEELEECGGNGLLRCVLMSKYRNGKGGNVPEFTATGVPIAAVSGSRSKDDRRSNIEVNAELESE